MYIKNFHTNICILLQILQALKSDSMKWGAQYPQYPRRLSTTTTTTTTSTTTSNPLNPENLFTHYIVKEQKRLLETEGEKPSAAWIEHQKRRFLLTNSPLLANNSSTFSSTHLVVDNQSDNNDNKIPKAIPDIENKRNNVFSFTTNLTTVLEPFDRSESKSDEKESDLEDTKSDGTKLNKLKKESIQIDDKILLNSASSENNKKVKTHTPHTPRPNSRFEENRHKNKLNKGGFALKTPSFKGFLEFLKSIQNGLLSKAKNGIQDKITRLKDLRDTILLNIEDRVGSLLQDKPAKTRQARGLFDSDSEHTEFPTAETALMTLSFLTFAVFLIKLVLQVVNTLKSRHYNFYGFSSNVEALRRVDQNKNAKIYAEAEESELDNISRIIAATEKYENKEI